MFLLFLLLRFVKTLNLASDLLLSYAYISIYILDANKACDHTSTAVDAHVCI